MNEDQYAAANEARLTANDIRRENERIDIIMGKAQDPSTALRSMRKLAERLIWHIDFALGESEERA